MIVEFDNGKQIVIKRCLGCAVIKEVMGVLNCFCKECLTKAPEKDYYDEYYRDGGGISDKKK